MNAQDVKAFLHVRQVNCHLAVKTAGAQERRIQDIRAVCGRNDNDAGISGEAVHLDKNLVKRLLSLIMSAAQSASAAAAYSINLINEDDARGILPSSLKQIPDTGGAHAYKHLNEIRTGGVEEVDACLACDSTRKQRLSCSWRAYKQDALRNLRSDFHITVRVFKKVHDFLKLVLAFFLSGNILEQHLVFLGAVLHGMALAELAHHPASSRCADLAVHGEDDHDEDDPRQEIDQDVPERYACYRAHNFNALNRKSLHQRRIIIRDAAGSVETAVCHKVYDALILNIDLSDRAGVNSAHEGRIADFRSPLA